MAIVSSTVAAIGGGMMAAGSVMGYMGQKKAAKANAKAMQNQANANKYQNAVRRRALIQSTRMTIGGLATSYASSGAGSVRTSSQQAVMSSQRTGTARAMRDSAILQQYGDIAVDLSMQAQKANTFASLGGAISSIGMFGVTNADALGKLFGGTTGSPTVVKQTTSGASGMQSTNMITGATQGSNYMSTAPRFDPFR